MSRAAKTIVMAGIIAIAGWKCAMAPLTGGSDTEVSGRILAANGEYAAGATVTLIPADYLPLPGTALSSGIRAVTDNYGIYRIHNIAEGTYHLVADNGAGLGIFSSGVRVDARKTFEVPDLTVKAPATLVVPLPDSLQTAGGYVYMPGTFSIVRSAAGATSVRFDSLAQGTYPSVVYQRDAAGPAIALFTGVAIDSAGPFVLDPFGDWQHETRISLNTTATGADIVRGVSHFPVLLRLTAVEIDFSKARREGEDLRIVRNDNSLMPFEIEEWDSATATATLWVRADTIVPAAAAPLCRLLYGNPSARRPSLPLPVFDTAQGFQGVWHFGEAGGDVKIDATANNFSGTPAELDGSSDVTGMTGRALDFDGSSQCVTVLNARQSRLDVQVDSVYTISAWVYGRNLQRDSRVIVSKGSAQYGLKMNEQNRWEFYAALRGYGMDTTTTAPATIGVWTHLAGVRRGMRQYLYVNGALADSTADAAATSATLSNNYYDLTIGRQSDDQSQWFDGLIDEVRVENRARTPEWARLCYENQKPGQRFVSFEKIR